MAHRLHMPHTWPLDSLAQRGAGPSFPILWTYGYGISGYLVALCQLSGCCAVKWLALRGIRVVQDTMRRTFLWGVVLAYIWSTVLDIMHCLRLTHSKWTSHLSADTSCQNGSAGTVNNIKFTIKNERSIIGDSPVGFCVVIYCLKTICRIFTVPNNQLPPNANSTFHLFLFYVVQQWLRLHMNSSFIKTHFW